MVRFITQSQGSGKINDEHTWLKKAEKHVKCFKIIFKFIVEEKYLLCLEVL